MIPLNSIQGLPKNAFWYLALRGLAGAAIFVLCGLLAHGPMAGLLYLVATILLVGAVLRYRCFSFVLTDKSISINSGVFFQRSCTIRFDRIQDIDTSRDPLHQLLGLESVAIWTASLDQRSANSNRPDGLLVLDAGSAAWLVDYLSNPPTADARQTVPVNARRQANTAFAFVFAIAVLIAVTALMFSKKAVVVTPATSTSTADMVSGGAYSTACAIHDPSNANGIKHCPTEARRCAHEVEFPSRPTQSQVLLRLDNRSREIVKLYWLDPEGKRALYASLAPGREVSQQSRIGAHWLVSTQAGRCVGIFDAENMSLGIF